MILTDLMYQDKIKSLLIKHKHELSQLKEQHRLFLVDKWWNENRNIIGFTVELSFNRFRPVKISDVISTTSVYDSTVIIFTFPFELINKNDIKIIKYLNPHI